MHWNTWRRGRGNAWTCGWLLACVLAVWPSLVLGDRVKLDNGTELVGNVTAIDEQTLTLSTDYAGEVAIERDRIVGVVTEAEVAVDLPSGERLRGRLVHDEQGQRLVGGAAGEVTVDLQQVQTLWPTGQIPVMPPPAAPDVQAEFEAQEARHDAEVAAIEAEHEQAVAELEEKLEANPWTLTLEAGFNGRTGNVERKELRGRVAANRDDGDSRLLAFLQGNWAKEDGNRSANEIMGGVHVEEDLTDRLFVFGKIDLEFDEFENLDLRTKVTTGLGYFFIREDDQTLKGRLGVGYQHESFDDGTSEDQGILELGVEYERRLAPWLLFKHSTVYYPTFDSLSDFRVEMDNAAEIPLTDDEDWKLRLGVRNEYDAQPRPGVERLDTTYFANIAFEFK